jgi:hypothetical protein
MINPVFSSGLATVLQRYAGMKRALGRQFDSAAHALQSLDRLLAKEGYLTRLRLRPTRCISAAAVHRG